MEPVDGYEMDDDGMPDGLESDGVEGLDTAGQTGVEGTQEGQPVGADEPRFGTTISYEELENPETGASIEWNIDEGYTDASTGEPVDYWDTESR